jgi:hypothetical protein
VLRRLRRAVAGEEAGMFLFFSNRMGCGGSLLVSAIVTLIVLALLRACNHA